jgi:hypothetical protein
MILDKSRRAKSWKRERVLKIDGTGLNIWVMSLWIFLSQFVNQAGRKCMEDCVTLGESGSVFLRFRLI